ncbi:uncharacterized protein LOC141537461 isoform X2 [Cotesia typhae]|uniref:uncharacterized protein LOC141537461 isoform X2 n=1 Tax=Cotesia typhae TaxID=2053667 RepID=UPI003D6835A6
MKLVLMFYNRIDMFYSSFKSPMIRISIKGIVIPECENPNPMLGSVSPNSSKIYYQQLNELTDWVYNRKEFFDIKSHNIVNLMTEREILTSSVTNPKVSRIETLSNHRICDDDGPSVIAFFHINYQGGHDLLPTPFKTLSDMIVRKFLSTK